jgi:UDP-glucuronate 4-epimerase
MLPAIVMRAIDNEEPLHLYNHGNMHRDWTYIDDIVSGIVAARNRPQGYEVINLGRGEPAHIKELVEELAHLAGKSPSIVEVPMPPADVPITFASIDKAVELLDYKPSVDLKHGLRLFFDWYRNQ